MENLGSPKHDIDFEYYRRRARLLRNEAIRDLFMTVARLFVHALRRVSRFSHRPADHAH